MLQANFSQIVHFRSYAIDQGFSNLFLTWAVIYKLDNKDTTNVLQVTTL